MRLKRHSNINSVHFFFADIFLMNIFHLVLDQMFWHFPNISNKTSVRKARIIRSSITLAIAHVINSSYVGFAN